MIGPGSSLFEESEVEAWSSNAEQEGDQSSRARSQLGVSVPDLCVSPFPNSLPADSLLLYLREASVD